MAKYELNEAQAATLLQMLENANIKGADSEAITGLKQQLRHPVGDTPIPDTSKDKK